MLSAFNAINNASVTEGDVLQFVDTNFKGEGLELEGVALDDFNPNPAFLNNVTDPFVRAWAVIVNSFWPTLARNTNMSALCTGGECESTLIPLNHTFVVPGGRFREIYYWDSYFVMIGLLASELHSVAKSTLLNFMDQIERFGFIPNGGRIYYLDRSQPPFFIPVSMHSLFLVLNPG